MSTLSILGITGSIGQSTLRVLRAHPNDFQPVAFTAYSNVQGLIEAALEFRPQFVAIADETQKQTLIEGLSGTGIACGAGESATLDAAAMSSDVLLCAISGAAALQSTFIGARRGARLALANKESIVCAGALLKAEVARAGGMILPVDSEHAAVFRLMQGEHSASISKLILTASGGPFRNFSSEQLTIATPMQALQHPTWAMGRKITIDSATLMNKGLELIEASILFDMHEEKIDVVLEPRSLIHALVEFADGSMTAEFSHPDMMMPIAAALFWPERKALPTRKLNLTELGAIEFLPPDHMKFPALTLARTAAREGGALPIVFNAANEVAVEQFLNGKIGFLDIANTVEVVMNTYIQKYGNSEMQSLEEVVAQDCVVRRLMLNSSSIYSNIVH